MGNPSPRYTAEFKQKAVELHKKSGTTYTEVARGLSCDAGSLSNWTKKADAAVRARHTRCGVGGADLPGQGQGEGHLRHAQDAHAAAGAGRWAFARRASA